MNLLRSLENNKKLKLLDISENLLSQEGGRYILKLLDINNRIDSILIDKNQVSEQTKRLINNRLEDNKSVR